MKFIEVPTVLVETHREVMGLTSDRIPSLTKICPDEISAYSQCIPDKSDKDAIIIYLKGGHQFYSSIGMKEFERILEKHIQ